MHYRSASQTFLCCGPATSSAEAARSLVIKFHFKKIGVGGDLNTTPRCQVFGIIMIAIPDNARVNSSRFCATDTGTTSVRYFEEIERPDNPSLNCRRILVLSRTRSFIQLKIRNVILHTK